MAGKDQPGDERGSAWLLLLLLLPLALIVLRGGSGFAYPSAEAPFSDLTLTHYTNTAFLRDQLFASGRLPLWAGTILSGYPFAANPLSGMWYPFGWPALVLPLPLAFNLLVGLHLSWGALGLYLLLRRCGLQRGPALFGGLAFGLLPKLYAHYGAGHLTLLYAVPWTPWLLLAAQHGEQNRRWQRGLLSGLVLAVIFLADVRWAAYAGALYLAWSLRRSWPRRHAGSSREAFGRLVSNLAAPLLLAAVLAAVLWLPMLEYTRLSTRAQMTPQETFEFSLAPAGLLGLFYPPLDGGAHETTLYPGAVVLLLGLLGTLAWRKIPAVRFWTLTGLAALVFSLGVYLPGFELLARLPLVGLLRVPPRALFLLGLALAVLAAYALDSWPLFMQTPPARRARLLVVGLLGFGLLVSALVVLVVRPEQPGPFIWGALALGAAGLLLLAGLRAGSQPAFLLAGALLLLALDSGLSGQAMLSYRSTEAVQAPDAALGEFLAGQPGRFRTYSPGFSLLQHNAYTHRIETADGVDPLQLRAYTDFMQSASGVPNQGYSVTLPPLADGLESNRAYSPDPALLGLLNVRYLLADFPLPALPDLQLLGDVEGTRVYENLASRPHARVESGPENWQAAAILEDNPNRIVLEATGPGELVLAENMYPGWQVTVDGSPAEAYAAYDLLRAVALPPGLHRVEWRYQPASLYLGAAVSGLGWLLLGVYFGRRLLRRRA